MKRLALLTLLLASSSVVAAPAPVPKPQRKAERPAAVQTPTVLILDEIDMGFRVLVANVQLNAQPLGAPLLLPPLPTQPPNADPPG